VEKALYIATDLGAGSGRVFLTGLAPRELLLREVRRFRYPPAFAFGHLRWNLPGIFEEIKSGIQKAARDAHQLGRRILSIGVDSWGVDYGLIDTNGKLIEDPICYRDVRTESIMDQVFAQVPPKEIFARTGIQFMPFNTLFQLYAHVQEGLPDAVSRLLLMPDLINFLLTGNAVTEYTNATTTQMVHAGTKHWDTELIKQLELPLQIFADIVPAGSSVGRITERFGKELGLEGIEVVAPATHDTGSAVAGAPLRDQWAFISSGTWSLVGVERSEVLINDDVARFNFTNEGGAFGSIRFLKNVMGLWILESCRKEWQSQGRDVDYVRLLQQVSLIESPVPLIYPDDKRFFNPPSMLNAVAEQLSENDREMVDDPALVAKTILDSLALRYASVVTTIESLTGMKIEGLQIVGGGSQNEYLNQVTATVSGLPVMAGPVESTAIGNAIVQAIAAGRFASLREARAHVAENVSLKTFIPHPSAVWEKAAMEYRQLESRYA